jgi:hypothetical protein
MALKINRKPEQGGKGAEKARKTFAAKEPEAAPEAAPAAEPAAPAPAEKAKAVKAARKALAAPAAPAPAAEPPAPATEPEAKPSEPLAEARAALAAGATEPESAPAPKATLVRKPADPAAALKAKLESINRLKTEASRLAARAEGVEQPKGSDCRRALCKLARERAGGEASAQVGQVWCESPHARTAQPWPDWHTITLRLGKGTGPKALRRKVSEKRTITAAREITASDAVQPVISEGTIRTPGGKRTVVEVGATGSVPAGWYLLAGQGSLEAAAEAAAAA